MSEFFKALEQAERDRVREDQAEVASAPAATRLASPPNGTPVTAPIVTKPPLPKPENAKAAPSTASAAPVKQAPPLPTAVTAETALPPVWTPATVPGPTSPRAASGPASVFRRSLRTAERPRLLGGRTRQQLFLVTETDPGSIEADAYRTVRANIELMSEGGAVRHIAITSASGGDGKSTTAANLAVVAAQGGRRVCLVDADMRRPTLHDVFGLPNVDGLALALEQGKPLQAVAKSADIENLSLVVAGRGAEERFQDVFTAQRLEKILLGSETAFDLVLFDGPPVVLAETLSVAAACDGVILVVRSGSIPFGVLRRAIGQVKQVNGRVLGVLLNQADRRTTDAGYYGAYHTTRSNA
jgi:protein-tyrosine kinase